MRWLFLLLLVINLGVFLWGYQRDMNMARELPAPKPGVGNLRLWSEAQPPLIAETESEAAEPVAPASVPVAEDAEPEPEVVTEEEPLAEEPEVVEAEPEMVEVAVLKPEEEIESGGEIACFRLGFLELHDVAAVISEQLADAGIEAPIQDELVQIEAGYWVITPPLPTNDEARQKVRDLKAAGIRDVWRFTGGEKKNAISLGLFSRRVNADRAKQRAEDRGFSSEVQARFRDKQRYWLEFSSTKKLPLPDDLLQQWEDDYPELELTSQDCP